MEAIESLLKSTKPIETSIRSIHQDLNLQRNIKKTKRIPNKYRPKTFKASEKVTNNFEHLFEQLFFKYLDKVILENEIELEIKKSRLTDVTCELESLLSKHQPDNTSRISQSLLQLNLLIDRQTPEQNGNTFREDSATDSSPYTICSSRKRKSLQPNTTNKKSNIPFLTQCHKHQRKIS